MPQEELGSRIEDIEARAEGIIKEAQAKAGEILQRARESSRIDFNEQSLDEARAEGESILNKARDDGEKIIEESRNKGSEIKASANKQVDKIAKRIIGMVTGVE